MATGPNPGSFCDMYTAGKAGLESPSSGFMESWTIAKDKMEARLRQAEAK